METATHEDALEWMDAMEVGIILSDYQENDQPEESLS